MENKPLTTIQAEAQAAFDSKFEPSLFDKAEVHAFLDTQLSIAHAAGKAEGREEAISAVSKLTAEDTETRGWELYFERCCPGDDLGEAYMLGVKDSIGAAQLSATTEKN